MKCYAVSPLIYFKNSIEDCFAYGEVLLENDYKSDAFNLDKTYSWTQFKKGDSINYYKDINCLAVSLSNTFI